MAEFVENLRRKFVRLTESLTTSCEFENDTEYHVVVNRHDGRFKLPPGDSIGQWVYKGFSISLLIKFPNGHSERIDFPSRLYQDKTHYISNIFEKQIKEYKRKYEDEDKGTNEGESVL